MPYQFAEDFDNEVDFEDFVPQPATPELQDYADLVFHSGDGATPNGYLQRTLVWEEITSTERTNILTDLGLSVSVRSMDGTFRVREADESFANYNATATYLGTERRRPASPFWTNFTILLNNMRPT